MTGSVFKGLFGTLLGGHKIAIYQFILIVLRTIVKMEIPCIYLT